MNTISDFEDLLEVLEKHHVRYLIIGGLAFIYHAKPRYTKDIDIWLDATQENVNAANEALAEFGSPHLLSSPSKEGEILQLGLPPNRIDLILTIEGMLFSSVWDKREIGTYGTVQANWIDLDSLLEIKKRIDSPRHQEDARVLEQVKKLRSREGRS